MQHKTHLDELAWGYQVFATGDDKLGFPKYIKRGMYLGKIVFIVEADGQETMVMTTIENAIMHYNSL